MTTTTEDTLRDLTSGLDALTLAELGELHRALKAALTEVKAALEPAILAAGRRGMTYVELLHASGYGSMATVAAIMKANPSPRGPRPFADQAGY